MGVIGIAIGVATEIAGIIKGDEKLVKKGVKRTLFSTGTMLIGDPFGFSDSADILSTISDCSDTA